MSPFEISTIGLVGMAALGALLVVVLFFRTPKTEYCWLLEIPGNNHCPMYLHPARGEGVAGFTYSPQDAQRFPTKAAAQAERDRLNGALGAQAVEHGFD